MNEQEAHGSDHPGRQLPHPGRPEDPVAGTFTADDTQVDPRLTSPERCTAPRTIGTWETWHDYCHDQGRIEHDQHSPRQSRIAALFENEAAWNAYQRLPGPFRDIIWIFDIELGDFTEAAAALSLPDSAIMALYQRAKATLRLTYNHELNRPLPPTEAHD